MIKFCNRYLDLLENDYKSRVDVKRSSTLNLIEALHTIPQKVSILLGLMGMGFQFLAIFWFGKTAQLSILAFLGYYLTSGLFIYSGWGYREKNVWFIRLFTLINALLELMPLAGWIWILYLAQENPSGRYEALSNLHFLSLIAFFFLTTFPGFVGLMVSLFGMREPQTRRKEQ